MIAQAENGIRFLLNRQNSSVAIISSPEARGYIFFPRSIIIANQEYVIKSIAEIAFKSNDKIKSIEFCDDSELEFIGKEAFAYSSISDISIPESVTQIDDRCFVLCYNLRSIEFANQSKLRFIGDEAYSGSSIINIAIPKNVTRIGKLEKGKQNKNLCYSKFQSADASPDPLIIDKVKNSQRAKSRRRSSMRTIKIAAILIMISLPCYQMLRRFDIWPSRQTVKSRLPTTYIVKAEQLFEFSDIPNTADQYRKDNKETRALESKFKEIENYCKSKKTLR